MYWVTLSLKTGRSDLDSYSTFIVQHLQMRTSKYDPSSQSGDEMEPLDVNQSVEGK